MPPKGKEPPKNRLGNTAKLYMKRYIVRFLPILILLLLSAAACNRNRNLFVLHGTLSGNSSESVVYVLGIDNRFDRIDTISFTGERFVWSFTPDTVTPLLLILPDGREQALFAEKGIEASLFVPDSGETMVQGGYCNDSYQAFKSAAANDTAVNQIYTRIDSFITADPFSEVTPMLLYEYMVKKHHAKQLDIDNLIKKMSGNMQDCPFIGDLKSGFGAELTGNYYVSGIFLNDTTMQRISFSSVAENEHLVVCVWASWNEKSDEARKKLSLLSEYYADRKFTIADISIDTNLERWKEAVKKDTVEWVSYCDTEGWNSRLLRDGLVEELPVYILFSGLKRIILKTGSLEEMDVRLDAELPLKERTDRITPRKYRITGL